MSVSLVALTAMSFVTFVALIFVFVYTQAIVGRWAGIRVKRVVIGFELYGRRIASWQGREWEWVIGPVLVGGYTKYLGEEESPTPSEPSKADWDEEAMGSVASEPQLPADSFPAASLTTRLGLLLVGPLSQILIGAVLLAIPVIQKTGQLQLVPAEDSEIRPSAVSGLAVSESPSTWQGQWNVCSGIGWQAFRKFVLFQPLENWGGGIACLVTCGAAIDHSLFAWLTCFGTLAFTVGVFNLLPLGGLNGGIILCSFPEVAFGRDAVEKWLMWYVVLSLIFLFVVYGRMIYADATWLVRLIAECCRP